MESKRRNLMLRICSGAALIPLVLWIIHSAEIVFALSVAVVACLMALEWRGLVRQHRANKAAWCLAGIIYIGTFAYSLLKIRYSPNGSALLLWLLVTVWSADTAAFACGRTFGGPKLAPKISPAKTWSGFFGAVLASAVVGALFAKGAPFVLATVLLGALSQMSDLLESWIKRQAGVKDSGALIPGHGGLLDRTDSLVLTAPALLMMLPWC